MQQSEEKFREDAVSIIEQQVENVKFYLDLITTIVKSDSNGSKNKLYHDDLVCTMDHLGALEKGAELIWSQSANIIIERTELPHE